VIARYAPGAVALLALAALVVAVVVRASAGGAVEDTAVRLVPADALAYAHLSTDPDREVDQRLLAELDAFPGLRRLRARLSRTVGRDFDLARDVRPWLGDEVGFALLSAVGTRSDSLLLLAVRDRPAADAFLVRAAGALGTTTYRGIPVRRFGPVAVAFIEGFMALGQPPSVRMAIDRSQGRGESLQTTEAYRRATSTRPEDTSLYAMATVQGVQRLLVGAPGALGTLGELLTHPEMDAVGASLVAQEPGLRLQIRQARGGEAPGEFAPRLVEEVPRDAAAYLGLPDLASVGAVLPAETREALGELVAPAARGAALDPQDDLVEPLRGEVALSVTPADPAPVATLVARTVDEDRTREALARLQQPVAEVLSPPPAPGAPPVEFEQRVLGDVPAFSLPVAPGLDLTYAVSGGRLLASTHTNGVGHVLADRPSVREASAYQRVLGRLPARAEAVVFLDLGQLLALLEQAGASDAPAFVAFREDLRRVRAAGAVVEREGDDATAEMFFDTP
jgi:hypothetical protein